jgi:hypothetical protein
MDRLLVKASLRKILTRGLGLRISESLYVPSTHALQEAQSFSVLI